MNAPGCRRCGHDRPAHDHYRRGSPCSLCDGCPRFLAARPAVAALWRKWRAGRARAEAAQIAWMYQTYPWFRSYATFRPGRDWQAVHLPSGGVLPPARTPQALHDRILADVQSRPVSTPEPAGYEDRTRLDIRIARPYTGGPPRGGGRL